MNVLVLNSGSSTLKFQVIATDLDRIQQHRDERLCRGEVERIGGEAIVTFQNDRRVQLAIEIFCDHARKYIGAFLASMGGADAVIFTGGIGENSPEIRARICEGMAWAGLTIDTVKNQQTVGREGLISTDDSRLLAYAIPTDEELLIARDTVRLILGQPHPS